MLGSKQKKKKFLWWKKTCRNRDGLSPLLSSSPLSLSHSKTPLAGVKRLSLRSTHIPPLGGGKKKSGREEREEQWGRLSASRLLCCCLSSRIVVRSGCSVCVSEVRQRRVQRRVPLPLLLLLLCLLCGSASFSLSLPCPALLMSSPLCSLFSPFFLLLLAVPARRSSV